MKESESPSFRPTRRERVTRRSRPGELLVLIILGVLYSATEVRLYRLLTPNPVTRRRLTA